MRKIFTIIITFKFLLAAAFLLSGYTQDDIPTLTKNSGSSITFEIAVPDAADPTRALSYADECTIDDIYVFVFETTGTHKLKSWSEAEILSTGSVTSGTVTLDAVTAAGATYKLVFLANTGSEIEAALTGGQITAEMDYSVFATILTTGIGSILTSDPTASSFRIPMWGESGAVTISAALDLTGGNAIRMQRSLAKIDVGVNIQSGTATGLTDFTLTGISVHAINRDGRVIPATGNLNVDGYAITPMVPAATSKATVERTVGGGEFGCIGSIYVPETSNNASTAEADRPYVIIKGIYSGAGSGNNGETYYRLDFVTGQDRDPVDLLRNYTYTFNITEVHRDGYLTEDDAINGNPVGVSYEFFPSDATTQYQYFCYNDVGYLASQVNSVVIVSHLANVSVTQTYKAEYMGDTAPALGVSMCDVNGNPLTSTHFSVGLSNATTVTVRSIAVNDTYDPIIEYYKVYLVDNPEIYLISEVWHNVFGLTNVNFRRIYYGRAASDTGTEGTPASYTATLPHLPNNNEYFAINWDGAVDLPASQFRVTRGTPSDSFYQQEIVNHPTGRIGYSENFQMPIHSSPNYVPWYIEWWNPYENGGGRGLGRVRGDV